MTFFKVQNLLLLTGVILSASWCCHAEYTMEYIGKRTKLFDNGAQVDFLQCAQKQIRRHPASPIPELVELARQAAWGTAHGIADRKAEWNIFSRDFSAAAPSNAPLFEVISPDFCRFPAPEWFRVQCSARHSSVSAAELLT